MPEPKYTIEQQARRYALSGGSFEDALTRYADYASTIGAYQKARHGGLTLDQWSEAIDAFESALDRVKPLVTPEEAKLEIQQRLGHEIELPSGGLRVNAFVAGAQWAREQIAAEILRPYEGVTNTATMNYEEAAVWNAMQELAERLGVARG